MLYSLRREIDALCQCDAMPLSVPFLFFLALLHSFSSYSSGVRVDRKAALFFYFLYSTLFSVPFFVCILIRFILNFIDKILALYVVDHAPYSNILMMCVSALDFQSLLYTSLSLVSCLAQHARTTAGGMIGGAFLFLVVGSAVVSRIERRRMFNHSINSIQKERAIRSR